MVEKKKTALNVIVSFASQIIILVLGLVVPKIVLTNYGSDTNGLMNTIGQIFTYVALLESGISAATCNKLYKPIVNNDQDGISYWVSAARRYYRKISYIYSALIVALAFTLPVIFKTTIGYWTIFLYVFFEGLSSVIVFYFVNCWTCLLSADGKNYITNSIRLLVRILSYLVKIVLCLFVVNIAFIQAGYLLVSLFQLVLFYAYIKRHYPWLNYNAAPNDVKIPDRNSFIIIEIAWTVFSSTDMIILSIFVSTSMSSVYSVYSMVYVAINSLLSTAFHSIGYRLGQTFVDNVEKYKRLHNLFISVFLGLTTVFMCVTYMLILPFVRLYTSGVTDTQYIYYSLPLLFCLVQLLSWTRYVPGNLVGIAGYAKVTGYISVVEAAANIVLSITLVLFFGIEGVLLATVLSLPIKVIWCHWLSEKRILKRSSVNVLAIIGVNWLVFLFTTVLTEFINIDVDSYFSFVVYGVLLTIIFSISVFAVNCAANRDLLHLGTFLTRK